MISLGFLFVFVFVYLIFETSKIEVLSFLWRSCLGGRKLLATLIWPWRNISVVRKTCHSQLNTTDGSASHSVNILYHVYVYLMCLIAMFIEIYDYAKPGRFATAESWVA